MTKRFSVLALVFLLSITVVAPARAGESQEELAAVKDRIASLEQQIQNSSSQRSGIAQEVIAARGKLEAAEASVAEAESRIVELRSQLEERQGVLSGVRTELAERFLALAATRSERDDARREAQSWVVQAYMRGGMDEPSIAFSATGISDVSVGLGYLGTLTGSSSDSADRYAEAVAAEEVERARIQQLEGMLGVEIAALETSEYEAELAASDLAIKRAALNNEYRNQTSLLARVDAQIAAYEDEKEGFEAEEASIRATIAAAAAAAKAKKEAAAKAAAAAAAAAMPAAPAATPTPTTPPAASVGNGSLKWPIRGPIDSPFGWRIHPITWDRRLHTGIDIDGPLGMPIKAAKAGIVIFSGVKGGYGNAVMIDHQNGWVTLYAHQNALNVQVGQYVTTNTTIGWVGSTGNSTGPHLHFELRINGVPTDPMRYL